MKCLNSLLDNQLIQLFRDGNELAFEALFNRYRKDLYNIILFYIRDEYIAEDILQEAMIKIIRSLKIGMYDEVGKFLPWSLRVSYNLCLDQLRKTRRHPYMMNEKLALGFSDESSNNAEKILIDQELSIQLKLMVKTLPENQQKVITYRHFEEMSFKEIASLMNTSINTTIGRMRYGLKNLRKLYFNKYYYYD